MKIFFKNYKTEITKKYIKLNKLMLIFNGINLDSNNWLTTEQTFKNLNIKYLKVYNKTSINLLNDSIYKNFKFLINSISITMFIIINNFKKFTLTTNFDPLVFIFLALKLNNKIYTNKQIKNLSSYKYTDSKLILFQFCITNIKFFVNIKSK
jgi:hypothetical protein